MLTTHRRFGVLIALAGALTLTTTACSGDEPGTEPAAAESEPAAVVAVDEPDEDGDQDSPYGGELDALGEALRAGTGADTFSVDGTTVRLHFAEGSVDDPTAHVNCSAAGHLLDDGHHAVLVYPDGEKVCGAQD